jgi:hypothetical protein
LDSQATAKFTVLRSVSHLLHYKFLHSDCKSQLPNWNIIFSAGEAYLLYCDCQPLPLFDRSSFKSNLKDRDAEVLFSILALALRFTDFPAEDKDASRYVEVGRTIISRKIFEGKVELSTIQSLCLLSLVDFTGMHRIIDAQTQLISLDGNTHRASIHTSLAMTLAHNAGLTSETHVIISDHEKEERRRCFWSLFLLKKLHGADFLILDFSSEDDFPAYPRTIGTQLDVGDELPSTAEPLDGESADKGIVAYAIQLTEVWFNITRYARRRGKPTTIPPWSSESEYSRILAQQMKFETKMPYHHRFKPAKFSENPIEHLNSNRGYWGPWLFIQFLYHTNLCLLNHPLLISLRLKNFKCVIPEIFLQHTSDLISSHASWIINFIDMLEAKSFKATDPFLGHCVAIVATIYLQESFVDDPITRQERQDSFEKCLHFIRGFGGQWPHVGRIVSNVL